MTSNINQSVQPNSKTYKIGPISRAAYWSLDVGFGFLKRPGQFALDALAAVFWLMAIAETLIAISLFRTVWICSVIGLFSSLYLISEQRGIRTLTSSVSRGITLYVLLAAGLFSWQALQGMSQVSEILGWMMSIKN